MADPPSTIQQPGLGSPPSQRPRLALNLMSETIPPAPAAEAVPPAAVQLPPPAPTAAADGRPTAPPANAFQQSWTRLLVLLGYAGPSRSRRRERRELVGYLVFLAVCFAQALIIIISTSLAAVHDSPTPDYTGQSQFSACSILGAWNLIWLGRLIVKVYLESWFVFQRRRSRRAQRARVAEHARQARVDGVPPGVVLVQIPPEERLASLAEPVCPLTMRSLHILLLKLDPFATVIWFFSAILVIYAHGSRCRVAARDISAATYIIIIIVYAHFVLTTVIPVIRTMRARRRASQPEIGKLSRAEVDRIPLVLYIPPPPDSKDDGPVTSPTSLSPFSPLPHAPSQPPLSSPAATRKPRRFIAFRPALSLPRSLSLSRNRRRSSSVSKHPDLELGSPTDLTLEPEPTLEAGADEWERSWERAAPYPFVRLPEHRATCMICLCEFEAPRRLNAHARASRTDLHADTLGTDGIEDEEDGEREGEGMAHEMRPVSAPGASAGSGGGAVGGEEVIEEVRVESPRPADARTVQLAGSGSSDAPEPLRLLGCGHVYHKDCVDQWLTEKSGRCPYCSKKVDVPPPPPSQKKRRGWSLRWGTGTG